MTAGLVAAVGYVLVRALVDLATGNPVDWTGGLPPALPGGWAGVLVVSWWQRRRAVQERAGRIRRLLDRMPTGVPPAG